jgi:C4-dicarboxylate-binding protein DctP
MHEVQKHLLMTEHGYLGYAVIVNKKFWDGLPGSLRGQLEEAMVQASDYANRIAKQENDESLEKVRQSGMVQIHVPSDEELAAFRRILLPVHKQMESRIGSQTINAVYRATGFRPGQP